MNIYKKIFDYLKSNDEIEMDDLFGIITSKLDYDLGSVEIKETVFWFFERTKRENTCPEVFPLIEETKWLGMFEWLHIGYYKGKIIAFGEDGHFYPFCRSIQDIPLQIFSNYSFCWDYDDVKPNEKLSIEMINHYSNDPKYKDYYSLFMEYMDFVKLNNIPLDPEYFNKDGELKMLYHPFQINFDYTEFGIEHLKDKEFLNFN